MRKLIWMSILILGSCAAQRISFQDTADVSQYGLLYGHVSTKSDQSLVVQNLVVVRLKTTSDEAKYFEAVVTNPYNPNINGTFYAIVPPGDYRFHLFKAKDYSAGDEYIYQIDGPPEMGPMATKVKAGQVYYLGTYQNRFMGDDNFTMLERTSSPSRLQIADEVKRHSQGTVWATRL